MGNATKARVLEAIEELGYRPNSIARQFRTGRTRTIGLIVPSVANPFWGAVAHEVERAATRFGYKVLFCNAERDTEAERGYAEMLLDSGVQGVVLGSSPLSFEPYAELARRGLIIAAFDHSPPYAEEAVACSASVNNELGGRLATQHLLGLGHRRIGFISGPLQTASRLSRLKGIRKAMAKVGLKLDEQLLWQGTSVTGFGDTEGPELGRTAVRELLSADNPPTAVLTINDMYALGCYAGVRDLGLDVPNNLSIVGFDDISLAEIAHPGLTTIRQPLESMARSVISALVNRIEDQHSRPVYTEAAPQLIVRGSTRRL